MPIGFGPFAFDRQSRLLWRDGTEVALPPRVVGVLEVLIDRPGQIVARQDLLDGVWKDAFVTDTSLAEAVSFLRQALGDDPQAPRYIQTVHRRGYRFLPSLSEVPERGQTPAVPGAGVRPRSPDYPPAPSLAFELVPWIAALLCAALAVGAITRIASTPSPDAAPVARFDVQPVAGTAFDRTGPSLAVSRDGRVLAWTACEQISGACALYVRPVDRLDPAQLPGTDGATAPFFSPDGRWVGFFADGKLKKIAAAGGSPSILADAAAPGGAAWGTDGRIVFAGAPAGGLSLVSDQGGPVTALTMPLAQRGEIRHINPAWLPNGAAILFTSAASPEAEAPGSAAVIALGATAHRILRGGVTRVVPAGPGYVLLSNGDDLQAATFDERTLTLTGGADSVLASVFGGSGAAHVALSPGGTLAALRALDRRNLTWSDHADADPGPVARLTSISISPDSRRAAGVIADGTNADVWIADLASGALTRVSYGGTNVSPVWSADGERIYFATRGSGAFAIASRSFSARDSGTLRRENNARSTEHSALDAQHLFPSSIAADGRVAATITLPGGRTGVALIPAAGGEPHVLNDGPFDQSAAVFSPDAQWLALESSESGRPEVVLRGIDDGRRVAVSAGGGVHPRWSSDGRALYYDAGRRLMRAAIDPGRLAPAVARPVAVFDRADARVVAVTPSGRLLVREQVAGNGAAIVILQWLRELRERVPQPTTVPR